MEQLVVRQSEIWQASMEMAAAAGPAWPTRPTNNFRRPSATALGESLRTHAQHDAASKKRRPKRTTAIGTRSTAPGPAAESIATVQTRWSGREKCWAGAVQAAAKSVRLEDAFNRNLSALAGAKNFEETVVGLAAAIHLLNARLAEGHGDASAVRLEAPRRNVRAA